MPSVNIRAPKPTTINEKLIIKVILVNDDHCLGLLFWNVNSMIVKNDNPPAIIKSMI